MPDPNNPKKPRKSSTRKDTGSTAQPKAVNPAFGIIQPPGMAPVRPVGVPPVVTEPIAPVGPRPIIPVGPPILRFPILLYPEITSLSPPAATVGGAGFTLTVLGNRFSNTAILSWNGTPRTTTFISPTQITAAISTADIASVSSATIGVNNGQGGPASNQVTFGIIPDINTIQAVLNQIAQTFATIDQFTAIQPGLVQALNELNTFLNNNTVQSSNLQSQLSDSQTQNGNLSTQNSSLTAQVTQQQATITGLQSRLAAPQTQTAAPVDVARSFKNVLDQIQQQAFAAGGMQTTLTNMQVQLKTLVSVQPAAAPSDRLSDDETIPAPPDAVLVFPDPSALPDSGALSTVSFSFSAIPSIKNNPATATPGTPSTGGTPPSATGSTSP